MPSTQELLQAITGMQQNAQAALPVIPNNGNPHGANNMPDNPEGPVGAAVSSSPYFPDWMKPSPSMDLIYKMLAQPPTTTIPTPTTTTAPLVPPPKDNTLIGKPVETAPLLPPLPQRAPNARQQARAEGDFFMMPKRGQRFGVVGQQEQQLLPSMPMRRNLDY